MTAQGSSGELLSDTRIEEAYLGGAALRDRQPRPAAPDAEPTSSDT